MSDKRPPNPPNSGNQGRKKVTSGSPGKSASGENESLGNSQSTLPSPEAAQRMRRLETDCAALQKKLQGEVARAIDMWRKGMVQGTLESQNKRLEHFIQQLEEDSFPQREKASGSIIAELKRENQQLRDELDDLRRLDVNDLTVEKLQELQHDNRSLRTMISKLQEEVQEKITSHHRRIQKQQDTIRKLQSNSDTIETSVIKLKGENQELKERTTMFVKWSEEETGGSRNPSCVFCPPIDLNEKLAKADHRLEIAEHELKQKRKHPKRLTHSVRSLEDIHCVWSQQVQLLRSLLKREKEMNQLQDRLDMFVTNIEILKDENAELRSRLASVREEIKRFRDNPMRPTNQVEKNVNLLLHMENIDGTLAEKAVQLDKHEKDLKKEQLRVRDLLIRVEELRRENRHLTRRLQKDAARTVSQSRAIIKMSQDQEGSSSSSCSDHITSPPIGNNLTYGRMELDSDGTAPAGTPRRGSNPDDVPDESPEDSPQKYPPSDCGDRPPNCD